MMASAPHTPAQGVPLPAIGFAPMPAVARILARYQRPQLEAFLSIAIDLLDTMDPNPDAEEEPLEDAFVQHDPTFAEQFEADTSWTEYHTRGRHKLAGGMQELFDPTGEDSEADGDGQDGDDAEDEPCAIASVANGPGCPIADPDYSADDEGEPGTDAEIEQMPDDVPALPVYALDPNIFNGKRAFLGMNFSAAFIGETQPAA